MPKPIIIDTSAKLDEQVFPAYGTVDEVLDTNAHLITQNHFAANCETLADKFREFQLVCMDGVVAVTITGGNAALTRRHHNAGYAYHEFDSYHLWLESMKTRKLPESVVVSSRFYNAPAGDYGTLASIILIAATSQQLEFGQIYLVDEKQGMPADIDNCLFLDSRGDYWVIDRKDESDDEEPLIFKRFSIIDEDAAEDFFAKHAS